MMNKQGRPTDINTAASLSPDSVTTHTGNRGLEQDELLIYPDTRDIQ